MHALLNVAMSVPLVTVCSYCGLDYFFVDVLQSTSGKVSSPKFRVRGQAHWYGLLHSSPAALTGA